MGTAFGSLMGQLWRAKLEEFGVPDQRKRQAGIAGFDSFLGAATNQGNPGALTDQGVVIQGPATPGRRRTMNEQQAEEARQLFSLDPEIGIKHARESQASNRAESIRQDTLRDTWEDNQRQREQLDLATRNADRADAQFAHTQRMDQVAANMTPEQRMVVALQDKGQDARLLNGRVIVSPLRGSNDWQADVTEWRKATQGVETLNQVFTLMGSGLSFDPDNLDNSKMQSLIGLARTELRIAQEMGAPQAAELEILERQIPNPAELKSGILRGDASLLAGLGVLQERAALRLAGMTRDIAHYDLDPQDKSRTLAALQGSTEIRDTAMRNINARTEALAQLAGVETPNLGMMQVLEELGLLGPTQTAEQAQAERIEILRDFEGLTGQALEVPLLQSPFLPGAGTRALGAGGVLGPAARGVGTAAGAVGGARLLQILGAGAGVR